MKYVGISIGDFAPNMLEIDGSNLGYSIYRFRSSVASDDMLIYAVSLIDSNPFN